MSGPRHFPIRGDRERCAIDGKDWPCPAEEAARAAAPPVRWMDVMPESETEPPSPVREAGLRASDWADRRRAVADAWSKVADRYGKPASAVEVAAAVAHDDGFDLNNPNLPERYHRLLYDRRALLNVIAALLAEPVPLDSTLQRAWPFLDDAARDAIDKALRAARPTDPKGATDGE